MEAVHLVYLVRVGTQARHLGQKGSVLRVASCDLAQMRQSALQLSTGILHRQHGCLGSATVQLKRQHPHASR